MVAEFLDHNIWSLTDDKIENNENGEKQQKRTLQMHHALVHFLAIIAQI